MAPIWTGRGTRCGSPRSPHLLRGRDPVNTVYSMRENIATLVADRLRQMVADGILPSGARIREGEVAERLEVSRTPLREALCHLAADGFVENRPRRGFFVQELDGPLIRELYSVRAILDPGALELAGVPDPPTLARLEELNEAIGRSGEVERIIDLDDAWHLALVDGCGNRILLDLIRQHMRRTRPLERAYLRSRGSMERMVEEHGRIAARLWADDLAGAVRALRTNMRSGLEPILTWFEASRPTPLEMARR